MQQIFKPVENGTHGRVWVTDESGNIAFSYYLKCNCNIKKLEGLTYEIAETLTNVFENLYEIKLKIKLPNDIVYNNRKIAGILTETKVNNEFVTDIVVGIGINTNKLIFNQEICGIATSIKKEFGIDVDNEKVITEFCNLWEKKWISRMEN